MSFKCISYLQLWRSFYSAEQNHFCNYGRWHYENISVFRPVALFLGGAEPFVQFWYRALWEIFKWNDINALLRHEISLKVICEKVKIPNYDFCNNFHDYEWIVWQYSGEF